MWKSVAAKSGLYDECTVNNYTLNFNQRQFKRQTDSASRGAVSVRKCNV